MSVHLWLGNANTSYKVWRRGNAWPACSYSSAFARAPHSHSACSGSQVRATLAKSEGPVLKPKPSTLRPHRFLIGGPIWAEPIHDRAWVSSLLQELEADKARYAAFGKIKGLLSSVVEELEDVPLYYK